MHLRAVAILGLIILFATSCERELTEEVEFATFSNNAEVYIDGFSSGLDYTPFEGSKLDAFSVDTEEKYLGTNAMRIDIPNEGNVNGSYAGAIFPDATGRDLTGYDALTFWAKGSQAGTINEVGFGSYFDEGKVENKYVVTKADMRISTYWEKYIIPIPNPEKLLREKGMFWYAEGPENNNGYTIWIDELKYEKLGAFTDARPAIQNGLDEEKKAFLGDQTNVTGLSQTFIVDTGLTETVAAAPAYFNFNSSNTEVAHVSESGVVTILDEGTAKITASLAGVSALGSLTLNVTGGFVFPTPPTRSAADVISIFSDAYTNVPVEFYNGFWEPFQSTLSEEIVIQEDNIISYTNFNFVGNQFGMPTVDVTDFANFHVDIYIPDAVDPALNLLITIKDFGADGVDGGGDDEIQQIFFTSADFETESWSSFDRPITLTNKTNIGQIIYENINGSPLSNFYLDNIYFYR